MAGKKWFGTLMEFEKYFWGRVDRSGGPDACWLWMGAKHKHGYGILTGNYTTGKPTERAHRVAWVLTHGKIDLGKCILHHCDNPPCCNPKCLFQGTKRDNTLDMVAKMRHGSHRYPERLPHGDSHYLRKFPERIRKWENHPKAKLTWDQVREIRQKYSLGEANQVQLAREYMVDRTNISSIVRGQTWQL